MQNHFADSTAARILRVLFAVSVVAISLAMWPWTTDPTHHIKVLLLHLLAAGLTAATLGAVLLSGASIAIPRVFLIPLGGLLVWSGFTAVVSSYPMHSLEEVARFASLCLVVLAAAQVFRRPKHLRPLLAGVVAAVGLSSAYAMAQRAGLDPFPWADTTTEIYRRLPGTFGNPNVAGHALVLAILASLYLALTQGVRYLVFLAPLVLFVIHLGLTHHRGGVAALVFAIGAAAVIAIAFRVWRTPRKRVLGTCALLAVLALALTAGGIFYAQLRQDRTVPLDSSLLLRYNGFFGAAEMAAGHPVFGVGPNNYVIENPRYWTEYEQRWFEDMHMMNRHVHNDVLEAAAETGLPGAGLYLAFLITGVAAGVHLAATSEGERRRLGIFYAVFFAAFAVDGLFGFNVRVPAPAFMFMAVAGTLEGQYRRVAPAPRWARILTPVAAGAVAVVLVFFGTRLFRAELHHYEAESKLKSGNPAQAASEYRAAERLAPWRWRYARGAGMAHYNRENYEEAIPHFERARAANPNWIMTYIPLIHSHVAYATDSSADRTDTDRRQHLATALELAYTARELTPYTAALAELQGRAAFSLASLGGVRGGDGVNRWALADRAFTDAVDLGGSISPAHWNMLAQARLRQGDQEGAETALREAAERAPHDDGTWAACLTYAKQSGRFGFMTNVLDEAIANAAEGDSANRSQLAQLHLWRGVAAAIGSEGATEGRADFEQAIRYAPDEPTAWSRYASFAAGKGTFDRFRAFATELYANGSNPKLFPAARVVAAFWAGAIDAATATARLLEATLNEAGDTTKNSLPEQFQWAADVLTAEFTTETGQFQEAGMPLLNLGKVYAAIGALEAARGLFAGAHPHLQGEAQQECLQYWVGCLRKLGLNEEAQALLNGLGRRSKPGNARKGTPHGE